MRRLSIWIASLGCLMAGVAIGATAELGSQETSTQRLAPVIAGFSLGLAILVLGSRRGPHLTKSIRFGLAAFSAVGWLVSMGGIAVLGWILESPGFGGHCSSFEVGAVDPCPTVTAAHTLEIRVQLAAAIGFFVILAVGLYVRSRDKKAERRERGTPVPRELSRSGA